MVDECKTVPIFGECLGHIYHLRKKEIDGVNGQNICYFFCILYLPFLIFVKLVAGKCNYDLFKSNFDISR